MPDIELDGLMVRVPYASSRVDLHTALHYRPVPSFRSGIRRDQLSILRLGYSVRTFAGDVNSLSAGPIDVLTHMRLASCSTTQWLVSHYQKTHWSQIRRRHKEPFALANECIVSTTEPILDANTLSRFLLQNQRRLQRFQSISHVGGVAWNRRGEPVTFIVST